MAEYRVTDPNGRVYQVTAPDDATEEQVFAMVRQQSGLPDDTPQVKGPDIQQSDYALGAIKGASKVFDRGANLLEGGYNLTLGQILGQSNSGDAPAFQNAASGLEQVYADRTGIGANPEGEALGEIVGSAMLTRGLGGPIRQGAAAGALMSDADNAMGIGLDAALGAAGGKVADVAIRGLGSFIAPKIDDAARFLHDKGVRLTPGQIIPALKPWEDRVTSRPFIGDAVDAGRQQSYRDFNRVALEDVLEPAGLKLPANLQGRGAVKYAGDKIGEQYDALVPKLRMVPDQQIADEITSIADVMTNGNLSPKAAQQFRAIVQNQILPRLNKNMPISGEQYRQIERNLSDQIARFGKSSEPDNQAMAEAFGEMQQAFQGALQRSNPDHAQTLKGLNEAWSKLVRVEGAASSTKTGLFSPAQFWNAVKSADRTTRKRGVARGEGQMQQLADAAVDILPSDYPDSGTAGRSQMNPADPRYWMGAAQSLLYGPQAQGLIRGAAMYPRPPQAQSIADLLYGAPAPQIGAAGAQTLLPSE